MALLSHYSINLVCFVDLLYYVVALINDLLNFCTLVSYMTPVKSLIDEPTATCLLAVSKLLDEDDDLGDDWRRLWSELLNRPLNEDVVSKKCVSSTLYVLKRWCRMVIPNEATIGRLIKALSAIYRNDVACVLEEYCQVR